MLAAIQFNNQLVLGADEIQHIIVEWVLSTDFDAKLLPTQILPKQPFGIGGVFAEFLRNLVLSQPLVVLSVHVLDPSPP